MNHPIDITHLESNGVHFISSEAAYYWHDHDWSDLAWTHQTNSYRHNYSLGHYTLGHSVIGDKVGFLTGWSHIELATQ